MKMFSLIPMLLSCCFACSAQDTAVNVKTTFIGDSLPPGRQAAWEDYLRQHIDPNVPLDNKAKKGIYIVVVKFIVTRDGIFSEILAETKWGYGMEAEVIKAVKSSLTTEWKPATKDQKTRYIYGRVTATFTVHKKKWFVKKTPRQKT